MVRCLFASLLASLLLCSVGCDKTEVANVPPPETGDLKLTEPDDKKHDHPHSHDPKIDTSKLKRENVVPTRENLGGRWALCGTQMAQQENRQQMPMYGEIAELILAINLDEKDATASSISVVAARDGADSRELKLRKLDGSDIDFECLDNKTSKKHFDFQGHFHHGRVLGSLSLPGGEVIPVRLVPTDERTFARIPTFEPLEETAKFLSLVQSAVPEEDVRELSKEFPVSPMTRISYLGVIETFATKKVGETEIENVINDFVASQKNWGVKLQAQSRLEATVRLIMTGYEISSCEKSLELAAKDFAAAGIESAAVTTRLDGLREAIKFRSAIELLDSKVSEKQEQGRLQAVALLKTNAFNPVLTWKLADHARDNERTDEALRLFAELTVLPLLEEHLKALWERERAPVQRTPPSERVAQLWKVKNGSADGLDAYLQKIYDESLLSFVGEPVTARAVADANQITLVELFTGVGCEQCVCSDVALAGINKTFAPGMVVSLRYHQHMPLPDVMANEDCETRLFNYYRKNAAPTLMINGKEATNSEGPVFRVKEVYPLLKEAITKELEKSSPIKIELTAERTGDDIRIAAKVTDEALKDGRKKLRIALAESQVAFKAINGIRRHEMVVRHMVNGDAGVSPREGALSYEGQINVAKLKSELLANLMKYEKNQGVSFFDKPLDLKSLVVVAFVQDDESRVVLQTIAVPVK